jgi:hypothetical protein
MANTLKFGNGEWATKEGSTLAYNDENGNFKPLPFDFSRSTTATRVNKEGLIELVSNNEPRIDFLNDSNGALLLEPSRSNLVQYSEAFDNAYWNKLNVTVSANQSVAPDGTTSADLVYPTTSGANRLIEKFVPATTGQVWTSSFFVKASGFNWVLIYAPNLATCWFNASTGVFGTVAGNVTARVLGQVNGFWRISLTGTLGANNAYFYAGVADSNGSDTATASGTNGIFLWGAQLEQGSYPTSYIPTQGSIGTRVSDTSLQTPPDGIIGQTEGTAYFDASRLFTSGTRSISLIYTSGAAYYQIYLNASNQVRVDVNGSLLFLGGTILPNTRYKIAFAYKAGDNALYINGSQIATSTSTTIPTSLNDFYLGNSLGAEQSGSYNASALYTTRLTDQELQTLTTI